MGHLFPRIGRGKTPAAFFVFSTENNSGNYDFLTFEIRSNSSAEIQLFLPEADWKKTGSTMLKLNGDSKYHTYRLRITRELAVDFPLKQLRGELFFFYRSA